MMSQKVAFTTDGKEELFDSDFEDYFEVEEEECIEWSSEVNLKRTMAHILDYKMFIAARRIQSFWRAHRARKLRDKRWKAAITIQRTWRGFRLRRQLWDIVEERLQKAYLDHVNQMATRIQAFIRGWYDRRHIHDMFRLTRIQTGATEDLVHCIIQSLHHIKRTEHLPGIASLQETCMTTVENLMSTLAFRFHNGRMTSIVLRKKAKLEEVRRYFRECSFQTFVPYTGPNFSSCAHYTNDMAFEDVANTLLDPRLHDVATEYQSFQRSQYLRDLQSQSGSQKRKEYIQNIKDRERKAKEKFCNSVISSMSGWAIWNEFNVGIKDIFSNPERQERFFKKLGMVLQENGINCNCVSRVFAVYECLETNVNAGPDV